MAVDRRKFLRVAGLAALGVAARPIEILAQEDLGKGSSVVTVFPDDNKKYLSTDLLKEEPLKSEFISAAVELLHFKAHKRVCHTCCEPEECIEANYRDEKVRLPYCPRRI